MKPDLPTPARRVPKPWGYELIWAHTDRYVGKILHIERSQQLSYQYHRHKDETLYLLAGVLDIETGTAAGARQMRRLAPGESIHIPAGLRHRLTAVETCDVLEASTPELDDVVRLEDRYGREVAGEVSLDDGPADGANGGAAERAPCGAPPRK